MRKGVIPLQKEEINQDQLSSLQKKHNNKIFLQQWLSNGLRETLDLTSCQQHLR
jgi:hypothetical protein